jgi:hypothetical protein
MADILYFDCTLIPESFPKPNRCCRPRTVKSGTYPPSGLVGRENLPQLAVTASTPAHLRLIHAALSRLFHFAQGQAFLGLRRLLSAFRRAKGGSRVCYEAPRERAADGSPGPEAEVGGSLSTLAGGSWILFVNRVAIKQRDGSREMDCHGSQSRLHAAE